MSIDFNAFAEKLQPELIALRREFHANPELSGDEAWTSARIAAQLDAYTIPYIVDERRNVIGRIDGALAGGSVALRADFDALPVSEETGLSFASKIPGRMHACGHDGHVSGLLGAAKLLVEQKNSQQGRIYLCFQMGEEQAGGAAEIVDYLKREGGVDAAVGTHIMPDYPAGTVGVSSGCAMAGVASWQLSVTGVGGHGSAPWQVVDPIKPASEILLRITALAVNRQPAFAPFVVSPCSFHAGTADNIIPPNAILRGTIRFFDEDQLAELTSIITQTADGVAASYGASCAFEILSSCPPVHNSPALADIATQLAPAYNCVVQNMTQPYLCSDNFSEFSQAFPGLYFFSGAAKGDEYLPIHHPRYDIDEEVLWRNAALLAALARRILEKGASL